MRHLSCLSAGIFLFVSLSARAGSSGWGDLSSWKDAYPVRNEGERREAILKGTAVSAALGRMLAPVDVQKISSYTVIGKNAFVDGYLIVSQCNPHDCGSENAVVVLEQNSDNLWVRLNAVSDRAVSTRWYGNHSGFQQLPDSVRAEIAKKYNAN